MKLKLMIALAVLALVFGMVLAACDNGDLPTINPGANERVYDMHLIPYINKNGITQGQTGSTTGVDVNIFSHPSNPPVVTTPEPPEPPVEP